LALAAALLHAGRNATVEEPSPTASLRSWRSTAVVSAPMQIWLDGEPHDVEVESSPGHDYLVRFKSFASLYPDICVRLYELADRRVRFEIDGLRQTAHFVRSGRDLLLHLGQVSVAVSDGTLLADSRAGSDGDLRLLAPMNGRIVAVLAQPGDSVVKGQRVAILEAMKMQHELTVQRDGVLAEVAVREGDQVAARQLVAALA